MSNLHVNNLAHWIRSHRIRCRINDENRPSQVKAAKPWKLTPSGIEKPNWRPTESLLTSLGMISSTPCLRGTTTKFSHLETFSTLLSTTLSLRLNFLFTLPHQGFEKRFICLFRGLLLGLFSAECFQTVFFTAQRVFYAQSAWQQQA